MLTFVCWKWRDPGTGHRLPSVCSYTAHHVNVLQRMLDRHVSVPHRVVCLTDDPAGVECETLPVPTQYAELGGCFRRLWMFSDEAAAVLGERFVSIDLDVVVLDDLAPLFDRPEPLVMNSYMPGSHWDPDQHVNGGMMLITAGAHPELWEHFTPACGTFRVRDGRRRGLCIGTDQAWIRLKLGKTVPRWGAADGVYDARFTREVAPRDARIVLFAGRRDPSLDSRPWVQDAWQ